MRDATPLSIAIVDYGMGNICSVAHACAATGHDASVTSDAARIRAADVVILPGVGAFGDAMRALEDRALVDVLRARAQSGKVCVGICLGMQLFMEESTEFGVHRGLGIIPGRVTRLSPLPSSDGRIPKVPQVGWNAIVRRPGNSGDPWQSTPLASLPDGAAFYFVHSYHVVPADAADVCAIATYGGAPFVACVARRNVFGCQFHPERSGPAGLQVYRSLRTLVDCTPVPSHGVC